MKILFTGDVNFRDDRLNFEKSESILSEVKPYLDSVDFIVPNLECPLADKEMYAPIKKSGPNLISPPENISFLKAMRVDAVTLANNHIGDFGEGAVRDTLALLNENTILCSGAGENIEKAYTPLRLEKDGISVCVFSVCENEFGIADKNNYGSAGYNARILFKKIKEERTISDYIIVVFHGGNEFNPLPLPDTVDRYRLICDMGADAVIGGHTHCPQGYEIYNGKPIVYSMGNFLFKTSSERAAGDSWFYGYMSVLDINDSISLETVPYRFNTSATKITVFDGDDRTKMLDYLDKLSKIIQNPFELEMYFKGWAWNHQWCPYIPDEYDESYNASANFNLVSCEAHLSQLKEALRILHNDESEIAKKWSKKIIELSKMPL